MEVPSKHEILVIQASCRKQICGGDMVVLVINTF